MTTPETRHRIRTLEHRLTTPTPAPLTGQTALDLHWQQAALFAEPPPETARPPHPSPDNSTCRSTP
ncbi:hypothetical protein AB0K87_01640 [Streptomyces sp. NPDC053705]|uniref:hypothetical protein n=1 Tax=unclassified Streptomyces TaxID=2593676 RepID=UPI0034275540